MDKETSCDIAHFEQTRLDRIRKAKDILESYNSVTSSEDDDILSEETRLALLGHLEEVYESVKDTKDALIDEDWELSQFWYDKNTSVSLARAALACIGEEGRIACVSSPSVYNQLRKLSKSDEHYLLEFDKRFQDKFPGKAIFYDYRSPLELDEKFSSYFDLVIADPPFLSEECLEKFTHTIHFLTKKKIVLCTGAVMEEDVKKLLDLTPCRFIPQHEKKLGNEFKCYANFKFDDYIS